MPSRRNRRRIIAGAVLLLLALIVIPPYVRLNRYRGDLAGALGRALGREVRVGEIRLRLFPQPGFEISNLVIMDDPAFSPEPMVQAESVTASLRLSSLFRRLEIGTLSLQYASLNLVRNDAGRWNLEALLTRAAQTPAAPTAATAEARPRFPYIEAEDARVNLKLGREKKPYALSQADLALWLEANDEWNMRLTAVPVRTDLPLTDAATLRVEGSVRRAEKLRDMALNFRAELEDAQLGHITRVIYGHDRGWRGAVDLRVTLAGTASELQVAADATVDDFRRYDIAAGGPTRLRVRCGARFDGLADNLHDIECALPAGEGDLLLRGRIRHVQAQPEFDLSLAARRVPMSAVTTTLLRAKRDMADDLSAAGELAAAFVIRTEGAEGERQTVVIGGGEARQVTLRSRTLERPLEVGSLRFAVANDPRAGRRLVFSPFTLNLGGPTPVRMQAWLSAQEYSLRALGDADVDRLLRVARAVGLRPTAIAAEGAAFMDVSVSGGWGSFAAPAITGRAQLRNVRASVRGLEPPVQISSASVALESTGVRFESLTAALGRSGLSGTGWVELPRNCGVPEDCVARFDLALAPLSIDEINRLVNPKLQSRPWYQVLGGGNRPSIFATLRAEGRLSAPRVLVKNVTATRVSARLRIDRGRLALTEVAGEVFGGKHTGTLSADFTADPPQYIATGTLARANMTLLTAAMGDAWASGPADFRYNVTLAGWDAAALAQSAGGSLEFTWRDGGFRNLVLRQASGPVRVRQFQGRLELKAGTLQFAQSKLSTAGGIYAVSGTASLDRRLDLKLTDGAAAEYAVTGTMAAPKVEPVSRTQAALTP